MTILLCLGRCLDFDGVRRREASGEDVLLAHGEEDRTDRVVGALAVQGLDEDVPVSEEQIALQQTLEVGHEGLCTLRERLIGLTEVVVIEEVSGLILAPHVIDALPSGHDRVVQAERDSRHERNAPLHLDRDGIDLSTDPVEDAEPELSLQSPNQSRSQQEQTEDNRCLGLSEVVAHHQQGEKQAPEPGPGEERFRDRPPSSVAGHSVVGPPRRRKPAEEDEPAGEHEGEQLRELEPPSFLLHTSRDHMTKRPDRKRNNRQCDRSDDATSELAKLLGVLRDETAKAATLLLLILLGH